MGGVARHRRRESDGLYGVDRRPPLWMRGLWAIVDRQSRSHSPNGWSSRGAWSTDSEAVLHHPDGSRDGPVL